MLVHKTLIKCAIVKIGKIESTNLGAETKSTFQICPAETQWTSDIEKEYFFLTVNICGQKEQKKHLKNHQQINFAKT